MKKQISAAVMIFSIIAAPSMAQGVDKQAFEAKVFDVQADKPLQLAELSKQEMKETEGALIPLGVAAWTLGAGAVSAWKYHYDVHKATGRIGTADGAARAAAIGGTVGLASRGLIGASGGGAAANIAWRPGTMALGWGANKANTAHTINRRR